MTKSLLVLAASVYQLDVIRSAKKAGRRVITLDNCPGNPGHREADKSYNVDTTDMPAVLEVARRERIDGVIAACTDVAVPTAAFVAQEMNLVGPPLRSAKIACSKILFREFLRQNGFRAPRSFAVDARTAPDPGLFENRTWIMKPDDSSGSKGIFIVRSREEFIARLPETLSFSPTGAGILEEYVDGRQGTCEGILHHGDIAYSCVMDRVAADPPFVATRGHFLPSRLPAPAQESLLTDLQRAWRLLGVEEGPFDCDFVDACGAPHLLEISPRIGGNCISSLIREARDFDIVDHSVRVALGENPELPRRFQSRAAATLILGAKSAGRLTYDRHEAELLGREPWVRALSFDVEHGSAVRPFTNGRQRVGEAIVTGADRAEVEARVAELHRRLDLKAR